MYVFFRVVKSVLAKEESQTDEIRWIQPSNDVQGDSDNDNKSSEIVEKKPITRQPSFEKIRTGATRIMNPKNKKRMETCLRENDASEGISLSFLSTDNDIDEQNWIQPGTTADDDDTSEMGQHSILHDFKESISETLHHLHLPHHAKPDGVINKHGLLETAMENILMEQASFMGAQAQATPDHIESVKFEEKRNSSIESFKKLLASPFRRRSNESTDLKMAKKEPKKEKFSLFDSAMKTMLNETAHIIEGVGVHPKSFDEDDTKHENTMKNESKVENFEKKNNEKSPGGSTDNVETKSYSKFCDNLKSHILTKDESTLSTAGNDQLNNEMPVFLLTKCKSNQKLKHNEIDSNTKIDSKTLLADNVIIDNKRISPKTMRKSNQNNNQDNNSKTLIHIHSGDLINLTNKTKLLAPDPHPKHRSHDENTIPVNGSANKHTRTESYGTKTLSSPTKVPTSSSSYNTSTTATGATTKLSSSKDGKDSKDTICRRSSDSDLSITPKGNSTLTKF